MAGQRDQEKGIQPHRGVMVCAGDQEDAPVCSGKKKGRGTPATSSKKAGRNMSLRCLPTAIA